MSRIADRMIPWATTIFSEINQLAQQYGAVNLGQGAPDFDPPPLVLEALRPTIESGHHQYAPGWGYPELRQAVADHAGRFYAMSLDPSQVLITVGATEGIFATLQGLINQGDEVILFEPFYDSYLPSVMWAGGIARFIPLHAPDWTFDRDELAGLFSARTRAIIINTPHNPTGKVFSTEELHFIAELCQKYDVIAITDEVYEHIVFDGAQHVCIASLAGMAERSVTLSSLGKTFSLTGWKIGWAIGPVDLLTGIFRARQYITFAVASPLQWAAIQILNAPDSYFEDLRQSYTQKRDFLCNGLLQTPLHPIKPQGGYFVMADSSALGLPNDRACAEYLIQEVGVASIPPSSFYSVEHRHLAQNLIRFSICKKDETLAQATERLKGLKQ